MASEYWLCVQITATPRAVQTEKDQRRAIGRFFCRLSNFLPIHRTNRLRGTVAITLEQDSGPFF
jgi:hypothetical protein